MMQGRRGKSTCEVTTDATDTSGTTDDRRDGRVTGKIDDRQDGHIRGKIDDRRDGHIRDDRQPAVDTTFAIYRPDQLLRC